LFHASPEASGIISSGIVLTVIALIGAVLAYMRISRRKRGAISVKNHDSLFIFFLFIYFLIF
jgi:hypothetical protein